MKCFCVSATRGFFIAILLVCGMSSATQLLADEDPPGGQPLCICPDYETKDCNAGCNLGSLGCISDCIANCHCKRNLAQNECNCGP